VLSERESVWVSGTGQARTSGRSQMPDRGTPHGRRSQTSMRSTSGGSRIFRLPAGARDVAEDLTLLTFERALRA
jgi:hypothetical protein